MKRVKRDLKRPRSYHVYVIKFVHMGRFKFYIGATSNIKRRLEVHIFLRNNELYNPMAGGQDYFALVGLIKCRTWAEAIALESSMQTEFKSESLLSNDHSGLMSSIVLRNGGKWDEPAF
jgi:predicted GIY-YIG superfamily endonuclease